MVVTTKRRKKTLSFYFFFESLVPRVPKCCLDLQMRGALEFHGLRVWLILALGYRVLRLNLAGFRVLIRVTGIGVSRVAGLVNFSSRVSGFTFKSCGFSGFDMCHGLRVWPIFVLGFRVIYMTSYLSGFPSHTVHVVY